MIPEFAIMGHPNEGKSSILSTLSENDSVVISDLPGETRICTRFPVRVDGEEILRFTDTPGFQNPSQLLYELQRLNGTPTENLQELARIIAPDPHLAHDLELLQPLLRGAGIIYVVDGSRDVRQVDRMEMEILRRSGRPRMAIINCKDDETHLQTWKNEFRQSFNSFRVFNAHKATYTERIQLLQALCTIDQDWQNELRRAIVALEKDWQARTFATAQIITRFLTEACGMIVQEKGSPSQETQDKLFEQYQAQITEAEQKAHQGIRALYKHNIFNYELPTQSLLHESIFTSHNLQAFGLSQKQLVVAGGVGGAVLGAGADLAAAGLSFGIFTATAGIGGALSAFFGGTSAAKNKTSIAGISIAGEETQVGPAKDISFFFVLLNRSLLFYRHTINWAHGKRDYPDSSSMELAPINENFTKSLSATELVACQKFFYNINGKNQRKQERNAEDFGQILINLLSYLYQQ